MKQVLFITDDQITALLWSSAKLVARFDFKKDYFSMSELEKYLQESRSVETYLLVDVLEEEITLTTIPHVNTRERHFLIQRSKERLYRSTQFKYAQINGRSENNRRDDVLLVTGITNDRVVLSWMEILERQQVNVKGMYSLPIVSGNILKLIGKNKDLTLLLSRQSRGYLRQSVFKNGKLIYSRNIPSSDVLNIETVHADLEKTRKYLQNQKLIGVDEQMSVTALVSDRFYQQLKGLDEVMGDMELQYVRHESLQQALGIKSERQVGGREIFSALLLKSFVKNHYARSEDIAVFKAKRRRYLSNVVTVAATVALAFLSIKFYFDINELDKSMHGLSNEISSLKQLNNKMNYEIEKLPLEALQMRAFVENMESIDSARKKGIDRSLVRLSQVLMSHRHIHLQQLRWFLSEADFNKAKKSQTRNSRRNKNRNAPAVQSGNQLLEITASIDIAAVGNERALKLIDGFMASLKKMKAVKDVVLLRKPIKDAENVRVSGVMADSVNAQFADFALTLQLEGSDHAS